MKNRKSSFERSGNAATKTDLAKLVDDAALNAQAIEQLTLSRELSVEDAYDIQFSSVQRRIARGEKIIGLKMGFTSREKAEQMGVNELIYGYLTDNMHIDNAGIADLSRFIHARAEPELAVKFGKELRGDPSLDEAWDAVESVTVAIEIIDSRYRDFKFSLADVVADNSSSSAFVLGDWVEKPRDPSGLAINMRFGDTLVAHGSTSNVMGNPAIAIATGARMLSARNQQLDAGWVMLTGGATAAVALKPGVRVVADAEGVGRVAFTTSAAVPH